MNLLIKINSPSSQICEEALTLAFAMVAFEHEVQLWLGEDCFPCLIEKDSRLRKMLSSLDMYDMPPAWLAIGNDSLERLKKVATNFPKLQQQLVLLPEKINLTQFDTVMAF